MSEAPLKRKLEDASEAKDCKKLQQKNLTEIDENKLQSDGNVACNGEPNVARSVVSLGKGKTMATELDENLLKDDGKSGKPSAEASGSVSAGLEDIEGLGEGEVLEATLEQDDIEQEAEEEELSGIDTENDSVDNDDDDGEEDDEDASSDEDEGDDDSDEEEVEDEMPTTTSSSVQAQDAGKGKGKGKVIEERKGKEKVVDVKGKGIMIDDKGKGKAIAEDESAPHSDGDAGYLSEDPLDEVDLNNILPTRTRRRSSSTQYDFVDQGDDAEEDDDDSYA